MEPLYYECHITLEPVLDDTKHAELEALCDEYGFKVAKLFMDSGLRSTKDSFVTGRAGEYNDIFHRMTYLSVRLRLEGFKLIKRKIEAIVLSQYEERSREHA